MEHDGGEGEKRIYVYIYVCMYDCVTLLYSRNLQNIANQVSCKNRNHKKITYRKKKKIDKGCAEPSSPDMQCDLSPSNS